MVFGENDTFDDLALIGLASDESWAGVAAFEQGRSRVHQLLAFDLVRIVAFKAFALENGLNIPDEIHPQS
jgi:hypothetical protein